MSKKLPLGLMIVVVLLVILVTFQITWLALNNKYSKMLNEIMLDENIYSKLSEIDDYYKKAYIGELDGNNIADAVMRGYVTGTGDEHGGYLSSSQFAEYMSQFEGQGVGIGIVVTYDYEKAALEIITVLPDSPSLSAGLQTGDLVTAVNGVDVIDSGYYKAVSNVRGEENTDVELVVYRYNGTEYEKMDFTITRKNITYISVLSHMYEDGITGVVKILQFNLETPSQFISAVEELISQGAERFVFDVRDNSGGELESIHTILDYLLPEGPVIRMVSNDGSETTLTSDSDQLDTPMMVLINSRTASAAELFAAALKDYEKAQLIGTVTYGKGTVQSVIPLADGSALIISTAYYAPPFSDNYHGVGITPNVEIELSETAARQNVYNLIDSDDNQLIAAIDILNK